MACWKSVALLFGALLLYTSVVICEEETDDQDINDIDIDDLNREQEPDDTDGEGLDMIHDFEQDLDATEGVNAGDEVPELETEEGAKIEGGIIVLSDDNFDQVVDNREIILVEFYAPWCGHCKKLAPEYEAAAQKLKHNDPPVHLAKVDATEHKEVSERYEVRGYPTLKWFKRGQPYDYDGPRDEHGIVQYMQERADPDWKAPPEAVIVLTQDNFTETIHREELMLVEFYAPWCGHCKKLAPEYEKAAKDLQHAHPNPILLAKVDATAETKLAEQYGVTGYPTLKVFRKGKASEYKGGRDTQGITDYMYGQIGDASKEFKTMKELQNFFKKDDVSIVGFFNSEKDPEYELYQEAANELRQEYDFGHTFDPSIRDKYKINPGTVVVFNSERFYTKYEPKWHTLQVKDDPESSTIQDFIKGHDVPLVGHMNWTTKDKRYKSRRPLILFFYTVDWSFDYKKATQIWRQKIADIAKDYKDLTFAVVNEDDFQDMWKEFGFDESGEEMNIGILDDKDRKYPMEEMSDFDADEIKDFIDSYKKGKISPRLKSQPVPKKQAGPVKVVVGSTFEKIVLDKSKDVLIEFYAPWCGHCKALEPTYKQLAKNYKKEKNLEIAKMDATANEGPAQFEIKGYPTIYFVPANNKDNPILFEGGRELEDLDKFIKEHATVSFKTSPKEEL